ncbi:membrane lipoprotein [Halorhabdus tiamatea SARL4B]|uniref:Membrane lipoprotein n=1 Tax=Halorhabdus tiamatea SARL4B TaxID=1033806 RepID=U2E0K4_9EURY|nr:hypothetical protein [Halorhabdus tiamatea]ERJ05541.1 membrane lipoprotein [Halorhabdus tiamatea SARL4B]
MNLPTRRRFLALSTGSIGALSGCSLPTGGPPDVTLGGVSLVNTTSTAVAFDVIVESDGEMVYWESHKIEPAPDNGQTNTETIVPDLPEESETIVVHSRVDGQRRTIDLGRDDFDGECVLPSFIWQKSEDVFGTTVNLVADLSDPPEAISCQN